MKRQTIQCLAAFVCLFTVATARAHYLWITVEKEQQDKLGTNIFFEEAPQAGDGFYLDHFLGKSRVWIRTIKDPAPAPIQATEVKDGEKRWMRVALPSAKEYSVDAYGKFGVYEYGQTKVLLHYYARNLSVESHDAMHELGRAEQMDLDLVPHEVGDKIEFTLLWKGQPVAERMVYVRGPEGLRMNVETDAKGRIELQRPSTTGLLRLRSSVEFPTPGEENGEAYESVRHNITLILPPAS